MPRRAKRATRARRPSRTPVEQAFDSEMDAARRAIYTANTERKAEVLGVLRDTRAEVEREIARHVSGRSRLVPADLAQMQQTVDVAIVTMERRLQHSMAGHLAKMMHLGGNAIPKALGSHGAMTVALPGIDTTQLELMMANSHRLVGGLSTLGRDKLRDIMVRSTLAQRTPWEIQGEIGSLLKEGGRGGPPGKLAYEAERIYRSEGMRVANAANYARMEQTASMVPGARKRWIHGGGGKDPREGHVALNDLVIPMDQDFIIKGKGGKVWKAYGPHDPGLPPGEVINCTCTMALVLPGFRLFDATHATEKQRGVRRSILQREWGAKTAVPQISSVVDLFKERFGVSPEV
jgi:hypothetical protein